LQLRLKFNTPDLLNNDCSSGPGTAIFNRHVPQTITKEHQEKKEKKTEIHNLNNGAAQTDPPAGHGTFATTTPAFPSTDSPVIKSSTTH